MKKFVSLILTLAFVFSLNPMNTNAASTYPDLGSVSWAKDEILYLSDQGIISGYPDGTFRPKEEVTRGQVALMVVRDLYPNATPTKANPFNDVEKGKYYTKAVRVAYEKGIINGYPENLFKPEAYITRAEVAVIVDRAYEIKRQGNASGFPDDNKYPWAKESILDLNSLNIINGYPDGTFKPQNDITRAAFAKVLGATINPDFRPKDDVKAHFIDVGQGDSTLIQTPSGKTILIDGGRKSAGQKVVDYLAKSGINTIDLMVATHPDADHIGGLIDVLQQVQVKQVLDSGKTHTTDTYYEYLQVIDQKNIPFNTAKAGQTLDLDGLDIQVLNGKRNSSDNNDSSIVLKVSHGAIDFMLTGDAPTEVEQELVRTYNVEAEILKVGHHGASNSTAAAFVKEVDPEVGILSYGSNSYGHPTSSVVERLWSAGVKLYSTCDQGTITVTTNGSSYNVDKIPFDGTDNCGTNVSPDPEPKPDPEPAKVNVNTADFETLQTVNGIGPTIARNIIDYRNANGPFQTYEELLNVKYIGPSTLEKIKPYITL
ncbi:S-layer homology domain-containing protein [Halobacillus yeomjeoni]|uniref:S-layer homology domain-containing protein n=1 Tax=Halobacillus yeomjeoni TaxID=311194 RepID=A0A931MTW5_9BACI|nr:S-layer homology domain-containing protein [Halobacillus yeomjeoni]MBH0228825.1 S-layer homology domain-containing protein [Halobacillus yeomjeoni]